MHMRLRSMRNRRKWTAGPNPLLLFALSGIVFLGILALNWVLYSGVISMDFYLGLFVILSMWNLFAELGRNEKWKRHWLNVWVTVFLIAVQLTVFCCFLPCYTASAAADMVEHSMGKVEIVESHGIDTTDSLSLFVKKGYVFTCKELTTAQEFIVFFNPVSGQYYEMK